MAEKQKSVNNVKGYTIRQRIRNKKREFKTEGQINR
jgi:hypothetical protein